MVLTGFKQEDDAASNPPTLVLHARRWTSTAQVFDRNITPFLLNSLMASIFSTLLVRRAGHAGGVRAVAAPGRQVDATSLFFFITTKMMPAVAALLPIYLLVKELGMLDNIWTHGHPLHLDEPAAGGLDDALVPARGARGGAGGRGEVDGAGLMTTIRRIILPIVAPGLAATALICFIFSLERVLPRGQPDRDRTPAPRRSSWSASSPSEGLFLARLCAAATLVSLPVLIAGWVAQNKLVRGLSMGAVK